jgi:hypothetical protein
MIFDPSVASTEPEKVLNPLELLEQSPFKFILIGARRWDKSAVKPNQTTHVVHANECHVIEWLEKNNFHPARQPSTQYETKTRVNVYVAKGVIVHLHDHFDKVQEVCVVFDKYPSLLKMDIGEAFMDIANAMLKDMGV